MKNLQFILSMSILIVLSACRSDHKKPESSLETKVDTLSNISTTKNHENDALKQNSMDLETKSIMTDSMVVIDNSIDIDDSNIEIVFLSEAVDDNLYKYKWCCNHNSHGGINSACTNTKREFNTWSACSTYNRNYKEKNPSHKGSCGCL